MKILKLQPKKTPGGILPRPFLIHKDGKVGAQKYWKGNPFKLLGFAKKPVIGEMDINIKDLFFHPTQAVGLYPVFKTKEGKWFTGKDAIGSFEVIIKGEKK